MEQFYYDIFSCGETVEGAADRTCGKGGLCGCSGMCDFTAEQPASEGEIYSEASCMNCSSRKDEFSGRLEEFDSRRRSRRFREAENPTTLWSEELKQRCPKNCFQFNWKGEVPRLHTPIPKL